MQPLRQEEDLGRFAELLSRRQVLQRATALGLGALVAMASRVKFPWLVGQAIADADLEGDERELLALLESRAPHSLDLARGYAAAHVRKRGLQWLDLSGTRVTGAGLEHLAKLSALEEINLSGTPLSPKGLVPLKGLRRLRCLRFCVSFSRSASARGASRITCSWATAATPI